MCPLLLVEVKALLKWGLHPSKFTQLHRLSTLQQPLNLSCSNSRISPCSQLLASLSILISIQWMQHRLLKAQIFSNNCRLNLTSRSVWSSRCRRFFKHKVVVVVVMVLHKNNINFKIWLAMITHLTRNSTRGPVHNLPRVLQTTWTSITTHLRDNENRMIRCLY